MTVRKDPEGHGVLKQIKHNTTQAEGHFNTPNYYTTTSSCHQINTSRARIRVKGHGYCLPACVRQWSSMLADHKGIMVEPSPQSIAFYYAHQAAAAQNTNDNNYAI